MAAGQQPKVVVASDMESLAAMAAERLLARISRARDRTAICLTGGCTPQRLYELLALEPYRSRLPWNRVHWFMSDERFVPADDKLSNFGLARRALFDCVDAPASNLHPIVTGVGSPEMAARLYEAQLKRFYGADRIDPARALFDVVLMGLGSDGHTASLFPHAPALDEKERWVVGVDEPRLAPWVPRVTLTFPVLASTGEMLFLVSGAEKRAALARVLSGEDLPASRARCNGDLVWLVDRAAAPESEHAA